MKRYASVVMALLLVVVTGRGTGEAQAQAILEVGGAGVIGDTALATADVPAVGVNWTAAGSEGIVYSSLVSPTLTVPTNGSVTLTFTHRYFFESAWDGGAVYVSVNGATATYLGSTAFSTNGYTGTTTVNDSSVWTGGENVFYGKSTGYDTYALIQSVANLGTLTAGDTISVEFRGGWDDAYIEPTTNWEIGTVKLTDFAAIDFLDVDFTVDGKAGFTVVNEGDVAGPWSYLQPISRFEIDADALTADRYAPVSSGSTINLNDASISVVLLAGTLNAGDSFALFDLSGGTTLTGDIGKILLPGGTWAVSTLAVNGTITCLVPPPLIEESFDYPTGNLAAQDGGIGFSGPWATTLRNPKVTAVNNFFGSLGTSGNRVNSDAWSIMNRPIGTTLSDAGLMADGATLWFSYVEDVLNQNETNLDYNFALCSGNFSTVYAEKEQLLNDSEGIGVGNYRPFIRGAYWQNDGDADGLGERVMSVAQYELDSITNPRILIVGKIEWGATPTDPETLTLYTPGRDLTLGTPFVNAWSIPALNQSLFDRISIEWKDGQASIDEIRFGATSGEVLPPDLNVPALVSTIPADNEPQASGVYFLATFNEPIAIGSDDIRIIDTANATALTTIPVTDAARISVSADGFSLEITSTNPPVPGKTYHVEFDPGTVTDYSGNQYAGFSGPATWSFTASSVAPTVTSIDSVPAFSPVYGLPVVPYTVTFDKFYMDDATITATNFVNAGTASILVGPVTKVSAELDPAVYSFDVTPTLPGTIELQVVGIVSDRLGNNLVTPVNDDDVITLDSGPEPPRETVTFDGFVSHFAGGATKMFTFDASGSDKLVVVVTGEHNFGGNLGGDVLSVTYDGVDLTKAVEVSPSYPALQTTSDLWYLDDPASVHTAGIVVVVVVGNGNNYVETAIGLSGTALGIGASASKIGSPAVQMITSSTSSFMISWLTMGGSGNTAGTATSVAADSPAGAVTFGGIKTGGNYAGHVLAHTDGLTPDVYTFSFNTALTDVLSLVAEFPGALSPKAGTVLIVR